MFWTNDVPDFDIIRMLRGQFGNELTAFLRRLDFDDRRIAKVQLRTGDAGNKRAGYGYARRSGGGTGLFSHLEIPERAADIDDTRNPAAEIAREGVFQVRFDPGHLLSIRAHFRQVDDIRPGKKIGGLEKVNMGVDVPRKNKLAAAIDPPRVARNFNFVRRPGRDNLFAVDQDGGLGNGFAVSGINHGSASESNFFRSRDREAGKYGEEREKEARHRR